MNTTATSTLHKRLATALAAFALMLCMPLASGCSSWVCPSYAGESAADAVADIQKHAKEAAILVRTEYGSPIDPNDAETLKGFQVVSCGDAEGKPPYDLKSDGVTLMVQMTDEVRSARSLGEGYLNRLPDYVDRVQYFNDGVLSVVKIIADRPALDFNTAFFKKNRGSSPGDSSGNSILVIYSSDGYLIGLIAQSGDGAAGAYTAARAKQIADAAEVYAEENIDYLMEQYVEGAGDTHSSYEWRVVDDQLTVYQTVDGGYSYRRKAGGDRSAAELDDVRTSFSNLAEIIAYITNKNITYNIYENGTELWESFSADKQDWLSDSVREKAATNKYSLDTPLSFEDVPL